MVGMAFGLIVIFLPIMIPRQNEWEVYHPINSKIIPRGTSSSQFIKESESFHVFGGDYIDPNQQESTYNE